MGFQGGHTREVQIAVQRLAHGADLPLPTYVTEGAAGMDMMAALPENENMLLKPGARALVPTGLAIALPKGFEAQIRPRSGLAVKNGITVLNSPGTVDADYRGEVKVILINLGTENFTITHGLRIAQMVIASVTHGIWMETDHLPETDRGTGGFGSTGTLA